MTEHFAQLAGVADAIRGDNLYILGEYLKDYPDLFRSQHDGGQLDGYVTWLGYAAAHTSNPATIRFMLERGARDVINVTNGKLWKMTPLCVMKWKGCRSDITNPMIAYGADQSPEAMLHNTELHFAAKNWQSGKIRKLAEQCSPMDYHARNDSGKTPLDMWGYHLNWGHRNNETPGPMLRFLLSNRAHFHPQEGLWWPNKGVMFWEEAAQADVLKFFFHQEYWHGIEKQALELYDRVMQCLGPFEQEALAGRDNSFFERLRENEPVGDATQRLIKKRDGQERGK